MTRFVIAATVVLALAVNPAGQAPQTIKVIADQDSAGPQGTNFLSLLMLLNAPQVNLLGITTVTGDQWMEPATVFALYATELTRRTEVPVIKGAEMPLLNTPQEQELREALYGSHPTWHGAFNPDAPPSDFIIDTIRANPGEVVLYCAGPLTNVALAIRMDPGIVELTQALYIMGGSSGGSWELNWWWDPEAASIVMRAPWKQIVITTGEAGAQVFSSERMMRRIAESKGKLAAHVREMYVDFKPRPDTTIWSPMWDEISVASLLDPSVVKKSETMYLDVVTDHGAKYGHTIVWKQPEDVPKFFLSYSGPDGVDRPKWVGHLTPPYNRHPADVQMEIDGAKFEELFVRLMSRE
jgi:inosine-uridine nucleoside N-ribohydrolase